MIGTTFTATGVGTGSGTATYNSVVLSQVSGYKLVPSDGMKIETTSPPTSGVFVGDYVELLMTASGKTIWADVKKVETTTNTDDTLTLNKFIPEVGTLVNVVRGFRTKFTATEIAEIKTVVDSSTEQTFTLKYEITSTIGEWKVITTTPAASDVFVVFNYKLHSKVETKLSFSMATQLM